MIRIIVALCFLIYSLPAFSEVEDVYYCLIQGFAGASERGSHKYSNFKKFTMKVNRDSSGSNKGFVSFNNDHPHDVSIDIEGINSGWITDDRSNFGSLKFSFYPNDGQLFQSWTSGSDAEALSAKCDKF